MPNLSWIACIFLLAPFAFGGDDVRVVDAPPTDAAPGLSQYVTNREPLAPMPLLKLPVGAIHPGGWLLGQLKLEADGMGGRLEEVSPWCKFDGNAWTSADGQGKNGWEEVPYWLRGYGDLGYVLQDDRIVPDAKRWIEALIATQAPDGWFGPAKGRTSLDGKPDMWPHMPMLNALQSYYDVTSDPRVLQLMSRYFKFQLSMPDSDFITGYWDRMRTGDNIESVYWLYNRTGDQLLLDLATKLHKHSADWVKGVPNWHNVNFSQGFREPAEYAMQVGDHSLFDASVRDYDTVMGMYGQVPGGGFGGDENCRPGYVDPRQGFETCGIVEFMRSFEMLQRISGQPVWADRCEELAFNSLPAAMTSDLKALHYLTSPNQVQLDHTNKSPGIQNRGTMFSYSPTGVYRCCQHNHTMGWPLYAEELWHATLDGGLEASLYSACDVDAKVTGGQTVHVDEATDYPFAGTVTVKVSTEKPVRFPLYLRVPRWCAKPGVEIEGKPVTVEARSLSYIVVDREWSGAQSVKLSLPMNLSVRTWAKNKDSVSVDYGPLTFSLLIGQKWVKYGGSDQWPEQDVYPTTAWNYGLVLDSAHPADSFQLRHKEGPLSSQPFTPESTPIELRANAKKIPAWTADKNELIRPLQAGPVKSTEPTEQVTLIPMGAARLRISAFPVISDASDAHEWAAQAANVTGPAGSATASASHCWHGDAPTAMNAGGLPQSSGDEGIERMTWWDHKGSAEWAQYEWKTPQSISSASVYWFDDTGHGACRVPASWRLVFKDGDDWKPIELLDGAAFGAALDQFNEVKFKPVTTSALRIEVQLKAGVSAGILRWTVK